MVAVSGRVATTSAAAAPSEGWKSLRTPAHRLLVGSCVALSYECCHVDKKRLGDRVVVWTVEAERCTALHGVPTMFFAELDELDSAGRDLTSLRTGIMAGAPCPVEIMKRAVTSFHMPEITMTRAVMVQTTTVSINGSSNATIPSLTGSSVFAAEWAMAAEPSPASLEKTARRKPMMMTPIMPPVIPSGEKAPCQIAAKAAGIASKFNARISKAVST